MVSWKNNSTNRLMLPCLLLVRWFVLIWAIRIRHTDKQTNEHASNIISVQPIGCRINVTFRFWDWTLRVLVCLMLVWYFMFVLSLCVVSLISSIFVLYLDMSSASVPVSTIPAWVRIDAVYYIIDSQTQLNTRSIWMIWLYIPSV